MSEPFTGAWQRNISYRRETLLAYNAVYACVTKIAADVSKMRMKLVERDEALDIWQEVSAPAFSPVLRKPNRYQNRIQFLTHWMLSKLSTGNTYVLKVRDQRQVVVEMYILDPARTKPYVTSDGDVYYKVSPDNLSGIVEDQYVPATEIIHDRMFPLFHPLCGVSPLYACSVSASQGLSMQSSSRNFFENGSRPGSVLTAPGTVDDITAARIKKEWEDKFSGNNAGRVAVLGNGLQWQQMGMSAVDSELIDQLKWTAETVCSCFQMPPYLIGVGSMPPYTNIESLGQQYYSQCLQIHIEEIELCLDEGLGLTETTAHEYGVELDTDVLFRMDTQTKVKTVVEGLRGLFKPNEARKKFDLPPVPGGDAVYMQQQDFSLEALNKRDTSADPFAKASGGAPPPPDGGPPEPKGLDAEARLQIASWSLAEQLSKQEPIASRAA